MKPLKRFSRNKMVSINPRLKSGFNKKRTAWKTVSSKGVHSDNGFAKYTLVICNGEPPDSTLAQRLVKDADQIIAADGGANVARNLGITPDVIIGDLDSITSATKRFFSAGKRLKPLQGSSGLNVPQPKGRGYTRFVKVSRQDNTDLEKALDHLIEQKIQRATIIAATGKRLDHTLGNLSVIWNYTSDLELTFIGDGWCAMPVAVKKRMTAAHGTTVSLVPFGVCSGITLRGLQYPLTNATMKVGEIGISNVVSKSPFSVEVKEGNMLLMILADYTSIKLLR